MSSSVPELIHRRCPVCDFEQAKAHWRKDGLITVRCHDCGIIYANPIQREFATGEFYDQRGVPFYLMPEKLGSDYAPVRFERELRLFREHCTGGRVLDVGCSTGAFLFHLMAGTHAPETAGNYDVLGTDVARAALEHAGSRGVPTLPGDFLEHDFGETRFAAITFWAVMEHLAEPGRFLRKAASLLEPGGVCLVLVPNAESLAIRLLGPKYRYIMPDHVNYFSRDTLRRFIGNAASLEVVRVTSMHFNPIVIAQDLRGGLERKPDVERARLLKKTTAMKQSPWLGPARFLYRASEAVLRPLMLADNLVAVARKTGPWRSADEESDHNNQ